MQLHYQEVLFIDLRLQDLLKDLGNPYGRLIIIMA